MRASDAPAEQYVRLGLPEHGPVAEEHLLAAVQRARIEAAGKAEPLDPADFPDGPRSVNTPMRELFADEEAVRVLRGVGLGGLVDGGMARMVGNLSMIQLSALAAGLLTPELVRTVSDALESPARTATPEGADA
jgi:hypothetical protein